MQTGHKLPLLKRNAANGTLFFVGVLPPFFCLLLVALTLSPAAHVRCFRSALRADELVHLGDLLACLLPPVLELGGLLLVVGGVGAGDVELVGEGE